jgi:multidrug efflux system outer membrane protein
MKSVELKTVGRIIALLAVLALAGCAVGPDFKPPVVPTPESYRLDIMPVESGVNLKWWELFNDPILYSLVTAALENIKDLKIAASRIEQARAFVGFNRADQFPRVDIEGAADTGNFFGSRSGTTVTNLFIGPALSWEIDFWGKFRRATESARAELVASEYGHRTVQLSLISEVVSTYYRLLDAHQRLQISRRTLESRRDTLGIIQKRFDRGIVNELDLNQAQIQMGIAASSIPLYEREIAKAENTLSILLGELPRAIKTGKNLLHQTPPDIPVDLPANILKRRPDVSTALFLLRAQNERIGVAQALRFPAFSLRGLLGVGRTDISPVISDGGIWTVGGGLLGPLIDFRKNISRVRIEEQKTRQALYSYENVVLTAFREVNDSLAEIQTYRRQIDAVGRQLKAAQTANKLSKSRYDQGVSSYLEVLETERALFSAALDFSDLKQRYLTAYVNLYKALGGGWITKEEMKNASK